MEKLKVNVDKNKVMILILQSKVRVTGESTAESKMDGESYENVYENFDIPPSSKEVNW